MQIPRNGKSMYSWKRLYEHRSYSYSDTDKAKQFLKLSQKKLENIEDGNEKTVAVGKSDAQK